MGRVVRFHRLGGPEVLQIEDLPDRALKEGELRVRVEAIGINRAEQMFRSGAYLEQPNMPAQNGYEASAVVVELGPGVSGFAVGEPISVGYTLFEVVADKVRREATISFITHGLEAGTLKPVIAKTFPFDQIVEAHRYLESNVQFGKIVVTV